MCTAASSVGLPPQQWTPYNRTNTFDCGLLPGSAAPTSAVPQSSAALPPAVPPPENVVPSAQQSLPALTLGAPATSPAAQSNPPSHQNLWIWIGIGVIVVIAIGGGVAWYLLAEEAPAIGAAAAPAALPAATVPSGLTWSSLIGDAAEAQRLLEAAYDIAKGPS
ncbi:hypothetical protein [Nocardia sp. NPDC046763]|uniref:hypothetical protein n=1 Tax=Nocardia sp. NPDC046763 TaxID=3155256 RepID=UPI0033FBF23B